MLHNRHVKLKIYLGKGIISLVLPKWIFSMEVNRENWGRTVAEV